MLRLKVTAAAVVSVAVLASVVAMSQRDHRTGSAEHASIYSKIHVVQLNPPTHPSGEVECSSLDFVEFTYQVSNRGDVPVTGLKLGARCSCEVVHSPPNKILPGESATIGFRMRAPRVGRLQRKIAILADGTPEPIVVLDAALRVKFDPPALFPPPNGLGITFIKGSKSAQELVLEAMEAKRDLPWIRGLDLDPPDGVEVQPLRVEDLAEADPALTRRRYHFPLVNRSLPVGHHMAAAIVRTRDGVPPITDSPMLRVVVVDSVAIVPNPLVFKYPGGLQPQARRIKVVNRTGAQAKVTPAEYDHDLLQVAMAQQAGSIVAFDITPIAAPESGCETQVEFQVGDSGGQTLVVRFEPSTP